MRRSDESQRSSPPAGKDTAQLLKGGAILLIAGAASIILSETAFGGLGPHGPHTNGGWLFLVVAVGCVPLGALAFVLGAAKWLRSRQ